MTYQKKAPDKRLGRPGKIGNETIRFRTSAEMGAQLRAACEKAGLIQSEFCRRAVGNAVKNAFEQDIPHSLWDTPVKLIAKDVIPDYEFPVITHSSAAGKTVSIKDVKSYRKRK